MKRSVWMAAATGLLALGCVRDATGPTGTPSIAPRYSVVGGRTEYLIIGLGNRLPADLSARVQAAGGTLTTVIPEIGVAIASSATPGFQLNAGRIVGLESVAPDQVMQWIDPTEHALEAGEATSSPGIAAPGIGEDETFYNLQWGPKAIHAPEAWAKGARGTGVRVAVIDGGLNNLHIDLNGSVDVARSKSFVPGFAFNQDVGSFSHATHVAGIVAAQDDGIGTIGIAPGATIIGIKALHDTSGTFGAVIQGIVYAARSIAKGGAGADIINMSLGATLNLKGDSLDPHGREARALARAISRATSFARARGVTVIASAGNSALDLDKNKTLLVVPAQSEGVIAVSATGPVGFALGATNFDRPASYTNFGRSLVTFAAPGGDFVLPGEDVCALPRIPTGSVINFCWVFDMVMSPGSLVSTGGYFWAAGTSMAAPHVAGVAALVIAKNGGSMDPERVEDALRRSADDLGKRGTDAFYGFGRVNALRALHSRHNDDDDD